jgi:hypothetical protein
MILEVVTAKQPGIIKSIEISEQLSVIFKVDEQLIFSVEVHEIANDHKEVEQKKSR